MNHQPQRCHQRDVSVLDKLDEECGLRSEGESRTVSAVAGREEACWSERRSVCPHRRRRVGEKSGRKIYMTKTCAEYQWRLHSQTLCRTRRN